MLLHTGTKKVVAVEPSLAFEVMKDNLRDVPDKVELLQIPGESLPPQLGLDFMVSIGILDHTPRPQAVVQAAYHALRPSGRIIIGYKVGGGNALYLALALPFQPHKCLSLLNLETTPSFLM